MGKGGIMTNKRLTLLVLGLTALVLLTTAGCVSKKTHLAQIAEKQALIDQAQNRIAELQKANDALTKSLADTKASLAAAQNENAQLKQAAGSLKDQIAALEKEKADLDKAVADGKISVDSYKKKVSGLNWTINGLKKNLADKEAAIASKDSEISKLQTDEAALKTSLDDQAKKMAALNKAKDDLQALMDKTVSGKNTLIYILAGLFVIALILAIVGFSRKRRTGEAG
jgi:chromosome segregation ATPase